MGGLGIKKFGLMNKALIAKQYWRICNNPNSLLAKTLTSKYCPQEDVHTHIPKKHSSWIWRSIIGKDIPALSTGVWRVGRGHNIPINHPYWYPINPESPAHVLAQVSCVADLIDQNLGTWKTNTIHQLYPPDIAQQILRTLHHNWKLLWKLKLPHKILTFTWKILHHALPLKTELNKRGINCANTCSLCNSTTETMEHIFLQCSFARAVWLGVNITTASINANNIAVDHWIQNMINGPNGDSNTLELVLTTLWFLQHREDNIQPVDLTLHPIKPNWTPHADWQLLITADGGGSRHSKWKGIAFIGKDRNGQTLLVGCQSTRLMHNTEAKFMAVYEAASTAISLGYTNIITLVDNKELEKLWNSDSHPNWKLQTIFEDLCYLKLHRNLLLTIKSVPKSLLVDTKALVSVASNHFVNVSKSSYKLPVEYGKTYLLRVINAVMNEEMFFGIAKHNLTVVAQDGAYIKPITTGYIMITPGQTMDILLTANQTSSYYYIAATPFFDSNTPFDSTNTLAILLYAGNYTVPSSIPYPTLPNVTAKDYADNFTTRIRAVTITVTMSIPSLPNTQSNSQTPILLLSNISNYVTIKLDHTNYLMWKFQITGILDAYSLLDHLEDSTPCPPKFLLDEIGCITSEANPLFLQWKTRDKALFSLISSTLSPSTISLVMGQTSASGIWRKIKETRDKLTSVGIHIDDEEILHIVLQGLPSDFHSFTSATLTKNEPVLFEELHILMKTEEDLLKSSMDNTKEISHMAMAATASSQSSWVGNRGRGNRGGRFQSYNRGGFNQGGFSQGNSNNGGAKLAAMATSAPTQPAQTTWISDTGATNHFTPDLNTIPNNHAYTDSQLVSVGNGQQLPISNIGNGQLRTSSSLFHLRKILHIPSMKYNLLSVNRFCQDNACSFHFDARRFQITDLLTAKPLYMGFSKDGLYPIHGLSLPSWNSRISALFSRSASSSPSSHTSKACLSSICTNVSQAALRHTWLGHPQPRVLQ
uniref:laccase n=1 Tax=Fagus sylvatica TaxID=28930 RepID=A0A2N9FJC4_FAGSY